MSKMLGIDNVECLSLKLFVDFSNGTTYFKKCKQLLKYQHVLLVRVIWLSKVYFILKCCVFFQLQG
jgi:hypothetical protein